MIEFNTNVNLQVVLDCRANDAVSCAATCCTPAQQSGAFTQHFSMLCMPLLIGMQQYQVNQNHDTEYTTLIMPEAPAASAEQQRPP